MAESTRFTPTHELSLSIFMLIELRHDDIAGLAVHIAARISALAGAGEVLVSGTVRDLVAGSGFRFAEGDKPRTQGRYPASGRSTQLRYEPELRPTELDFKSTRMRCLSVASGPRVPSLIRPR